METYRSENRTYTLYRSIQITEQLRTNSGSNFSSETRENFILMNHQSLTCFLH